MVVDGNYGEHGYLRVSDLISGEVARAFLGALKQDLGPAPIELSSATRHGPQLRRPAFEIYGRDYRPMTFFLWGLVPTISGLIGRELLPTYDYFRIYREGDICRVHSDRPACEHSVSLTLDYSDGEPWELQVARDRTPRAQPITDNFGLDSFSSIAMNVGDAVIYQGTHHRHGRITPNPNVWSAHLFLHFVERGGPYDDYAFDRLAELKPVSFSFC
jgi:hypothetical protein